MGLFGFGKKEKDKMKDGLEKTRTGFWGSIMNTLTGSKIDDDLYDELEEQLILADVGGDVAIKLVDALRDRVQEKGLKTGEQAADALRGLIADEMRPEAEMALDGHPAVILVIGVNGVGKTTSIAKLADYYTRQGKKVMLAAGDTFRAAASEQLEIWAGRAGVPIVKAGEGADPAAVIFDTVKSAAARGYDMVIADTAGRLHNKSNLMNELSKISRSVKQGARPRPASRRCWCWTPSRARTPSVRPRNSARPPTPPASSSPSSTARRRAAAWWPSSSASACRCGSSAWARASTTSSPSPRRALWKS